MVAERLEELVKQNVALTERAEHLQEQVASFREREKALNEALVTAQQLRTDAQAQADREAELVRREAQSQAERIIEEGQRSARELQRDIEALHTRRRQFVQAFRTLIDRYLSELEVEEARLSEIASGTQPGRVSPSAEPMPDTETAEPDDPSGDAESEEAAAGDEESEKAQKEWLSSLVLEGDQKDQES